MSKNMEHLYNYCEILTNILDIMDFSRYFLLLKIANEYHIIGNTLMGRGCLRDRKQCLAVQHYKQCRPVGHWVRMTQLNTCISLFI